MTKDPRSTAAAQYVEGWPGGEGRVPWGMWLRPLSRWAVLMAFFYLATFFLCAMMRRQWVDRERLQFPLARVPMDFTAGAGRNGFLPALFQNRPFLTGLIGGAAFRALRSAPALLGGQVVWNISVPLQDVFQGTPLSQMYLVNFDLNWIAIGIAYLVPADVSLSVWFFYMFGRLELQASAWAGSTLHQGGTGSELVRWQRLGAYVTFTVGALYMARRHLGQVLARALGRGSADDSGEPVGFRLAFWGFVLCTLGAAGWFVHFGMGTVAAAALLALLLCTQFVHARIVAQSGLYRTSPLARGPGLLQSLSGGRLFGARGATLSNMQYTAMIGGNNSMLGPAAIHAFFISDVFGRRKRWLLPAMLAALSVAIAGSAGMAIYQGYFSGGVNFANRWAVINNPMNSFEMAHLMISRPQAAESVRWLPLGLGVGLTALVMFMRARFYWWPVHSIGILALAEYGLDRMWFSFFLGWLVKVTLLKTGRGQLVRGGRSFFVGFIVSECAFYSAWSVVSLITRGGVPGAGGWI